MRTGAASGGHERGRIDRCCPPAPPRKASTVASADASRHDRSTDLPAARPAVPPDGPVTVGSLLRREGRAAHSQDRPVIPRARDAVDDERGTAHRAAVTAGAILAVTAVLGTNVVGEVAFGPGTGVDDGPGPGPDRAVVPVPPNPLSLAATAAPLGRAMAVLKAAGSPVLAAMDGTSAALAPASGAGIVAHALGDGPFATPAIFTPAGPTDTATDDGSGDTLDSGSVRTVRRTSSVAHHSSHTAGATGETSGQSTTSGDTGGSTGGGEFSPPLLIPPVLVDPGAGSVAPPPVDPVFPSPQVTTPPPQRRRPRRSRPTARPVAAPPARGRARHRTRAGAATPARARASRPRHHSRPPAPPTARTAPAAARPCRAPTARPRPRRRAGSSRT